MNKNDNIKAFEQALKDYLQPIFDKHFTLVTWARIWAHTVHEINSTVFDELLSHLPAINEIDGMAETYLSPDPWDAVCSLWIGISLKDYSLRFEVIVKNGIIDQVETIVDEFPVEAFELDLAREFEKKLTWLAVSKSQDFS